MQVKAVKFSSLKLEREEVASLLFKAYDIERLYFHVDFVHGTYEVVKEGDKIVFRKTSIDIPAIGFLGFLGYLRSEACNHDIVKVLKQNARREKESEDIIYHQYSLIVEIDGVLWEFKDVACKDEIGKVQLREIWGRWTIFDLERLLNFAVKQEAVRFLFRFPKKGKTIEVYMRKGFWDVRGQKNIYPTYTISQLLDLLMYLKIDLLNYEVVVNVRKAFNTMPEFYQFYDELKEHMHIKFALIEVGEEEYKLAKVGVKI